MTKRKDTVIFSPGMKLSDMLDMNYRILGVMSRMGIGFGQGDETVAEACERDGVSVNAFLLVCNVYTFEPYHPAPELMHTSNIRDIVNYLHKSHTYYMDVAVHSLANDLEKLL